MGKNTEKNTGRKIGTRIFAGGLLLLACLSSGQAALAEQAGIINLKSGPTFLTGTTFGVVTGSSTARLAYNRAMQMISELENRIYGTVNPELDLNDIETSEGDKTAAGARLDEIRQIVLVDQRSLLAAEPGYGELVGRLLRLRQEFVRLGLPVSSLEVWRYEQPSRDAFPEVKPEGFE